MVISLSLQSTWYSEAESIPTSSRSNRLRSEREYALLSNETSVLAIHRSSLNQPISSSSRRRTYRGSRKNVEGSRVSSNLFSALSFSFSLLFRHRLTSPRLKDQQTYYSPMSSSATPDTSSALGQCVVCGKETSKGCSACFKVGGLDWMKFCSVEHQKLVSVQSFFLLVRLESIVTELFRISSPFSRLSFSNSSFQLDRSTFVSLKFRIRFGELKSTYAARTPYNGHRFPSLKSRKVGSYETNM
jgi:hypothetical protein